MKFLHCNHHGPSAQQGSRSGNSGEGREITEAGNVNMFPSQTLEIMFTPALSF
jgi:hypothetical protein